MTEKSVGYKEGFCFYCGSLVGEPHMEGCPMSFKTKSNRRYAVSLWEAGAKARHDGVSLDRVARRGCVFLLGYNRGNQAPAAD